jgi:hypothetical protein
MGMGMGIQNADGGVSGGSTRDALGWWCGQDGDSYPASSEMPRCPRSLALMSSEVSRESACDEASGEQISRKPSNPKEFPLRSSVSMPPPFAL